MKLALRPPPGIVRVLEELAAAGGRPYVVGGAVRDALAGRVPQNWDIEVFALSAHRLQAALEPLGRVSAVGEAFAVYKLGRLEGVAGEADVSLPRRDSKGGPGHRGIAVEGDPDLPLEEAARRRDFTINAMSWDPRTREVCDPFGGRADLESRVLRAVDAAHFGEDPLRALRGVQLAARFALDVEPATARLCASMPLSELPAERVFGEVEKLLLHAERPSLGLSLLARWGLLQSVAPELLPLADTPQDPEWHPEGDVWTHTLLAIDQAARLRDDLDRPRQLAVMLGVLCHDLGKPATTAFEDGRIRSRGHEEAGRGPTLALLERWNVHTLHGYDLRGQVVAVVVDHLKPAQLYAERARVSDGAIRRLAARCEPELLYRVARADCLGRTGDFAPVAMEWFRQRVHELDVAERPPDPLLRGRDLLALGMTPGPRVGRALRALYERQLDGELRTRDQALAAARALLVDSAR